MMLIFNTAGGASHRPFLLFALLLWFITAAAQPPVLIQDEIDAQVWRPFVKAFNACDTEAFLAIHGPNALRVPQSQDTMLTLSAYREVLKRDHAQCLQEHQHRDIELRFERRVAQGNYALDTGYYLTRLGIPGNEWEYYGYFTVMLQRINGAWKIVLDTDSEEHATRELFMAAEPLILD